MLQRRWAAGYSVDSFCSVLSAAQLTYSLCVSTQVFGIKAGHTADLLTPPRSTCTPAAALPYAHHWRLARSPNDTFLAGNTHREDTSAFDDLQPVYAALYSAPFIPPPKAT